MRLYLFLLSLCATVTAFAQDDSSWEINHYEHTRTFVEEGYTYQCDVKHGYVTLYNKDNKWTYADQIDKRTGKIFTTNLESSTPVDENSVKAMLSIIDQAFSREEAQRIADNSFMIILFISPITGKVEEVCYNFFVFDACAKIPLSYYRDIEMKMKEKIHIQLTEEDKHLNFILLAGNHTPIGRPE